MPHSRPAPGRRALRLLLASSGIFLAACGGGNAGTLAPFSAVEVGKVQVSPAPDGTEATVHLVTNPATVCAIAYGRTAALGSIADDPQMGGTAITHHVVFLTGLSPATTYHYRLTATDARGQVFQTQSLQSFTTPKAARGATGNGFGPDIAVGAKVVAVSSQYSSGYRGAYAVDGNLSTEWATSGDGNRAFITIDLGRRRKITGVAFITRTMSDGSSITRTYSVVADNSKTYGPFHAGSALNPEVSRVSFTARFLRFQVDTSTGGNTGALEVEAFSGAAG